ncbi:hypothetical protein [Bradyrhizobium guangzhouense]|uniref:hypothetical protein n=1 Tax=Bradyrhizobium guangzhouense TaxID=1325095 RepID=UPI001008A78F|nr:hypothetical protein [Bradyrhizobium guangzhouense]
MPVVALQHGQKSRRRANSTAFDLAQIARPNLRKSCATIARNEEHPMMDILMLALGFGFFALAIGYTYACERL